MGTGWFAEAAAKDAENGSESDIQWSDSGLKDVNTSTNPESSQHSPHPNEAYFKRLREATGTDETGGPGWIAAAATEWLEMQKGKASEVSSIINAKATQTREVAGTLRGKAS